MFEMLTCHGDCVLSSNQSRCKLAIDETVDNQTSLVTSCTKATPKFHIDQSWESDIHVYISVVSFQVKYCYVVIC